MRPATGAWNSAKGGANSVQIRMDEARLRQELLRHRLAEDDRVRGEVFEDLDSLPYFLAAPRMDRRALEIQEDLDMVLGELDSKLRGAALYFAVITPGRISQ
jgi:hypothetical protein